MARAAQLGEEGDVDGAMAATKQADNLGKQYDVLYKQLTEPDRSMTVCDICGVFINSTDNEQRRLVSGGLRVVVWNSSPLWDAGGPRPLGGVGLLARYWGCASPGWLGASVHRNPSWGWPLRCVLLAVWTAGALVRWLVCPLLPINSTA